MHVISEEEMDRSMTTVQHQLPYIHPLTHTYTHTHTHAEAHTHIYIHTCTHTDTHTEPETKCNSDQRIHSIHNFAKNT